MHLIGKVVCWRTTMKDSQIKFANLVICVMIKMVWDWVLDLQGCRTGFLILVCSSAWLFYDVNTVSVAQEDTFLFICVICKEQGGSKPCLWEDWLSELLWEVDWHPEIVCKAIVRARTAAPVRGDALCSAWLVGMQSCSCPPVRRGDVSLCDSRKLMKRIGKHSRGWAGCRDGVFPIYPGCGLSYAFLK